MPTGRVKNFDDNRGFGFIEADDGSADVFLHVSALEDAGINDDALVGIRLAYDVGDNPRNGRTKAVNLKRLT